MTADFVPRQRAGLSAIEIEGEGLVFDEEGGSWHYLNPIGWVLWQCCDGSGTIEEISRDISEVFEEDLETVRDNVIDTLRRVGRQGLLEGVEGGSSGHDHGHGHDHDHPEDEAEPHDPEIADQPRFIAVPPSS